MNRERALKIVLVLVGIALFGWRIPADDVSRATESSESFGNRADDA